MSVQAPHPPREHTQGATQRGDYRSDIRAAESLSDTAFVLYAARQAAVLFWRIVVKRYPELK